MDFELRDRAERIGAEVYREIFDGNFGTAGEKVIDANRLDGQAAQIEAQANRLANRGG